MAKKVRPGLRELLDRLRDACRRRDLGERGESLAARELERRGYRIVERRWRAKRGEIDIVARDGETLVIVEVKTRTRTDVARPVDAVDGRKQRTLIRLARTYVRSRRLRDVTVRFDVVGVHLPPEGPRKIEVLKNAFTA